MQCINFPICGETIDLYRDSSRCLVNGICSGCYLNYGERAFIFAQGASPSDSQPVTSGCSVCFESSGAYLYYTPCMHLVCPDCFGVKHLEAKIEQECPMVIDFGYPIPTNEAEFNAFFEVSPEEREAIAEAWGQNGHEEEYEAWQEARDDWIDRLREESQEKVDLMKRCPICRTEGLPASTVFPTTATTTTTSRLSPLNLVDGSAAAAGEGDEDDDEDYEEGDEGDEDDEDEEDE